jgi:hypothetical protein
LFCSFLHLDIFLQGAFISAIIGRFFSPNQEFHTRSFGHFLQITLDGTGNSLINRVEESQKNIATVVSLPQPQVDPALYAQVRPTTKQ